MSITLSKDYVYGSLLALCLLVLLLVNKFELTFAVWTITALVTLRKKYSLYFSELISILTLILLISFFSYLFYNNTLYNTLRDFAYLIKPILGLLIGYNFCKIVGKKAIYFIINLGVLTALIHILTLAFSFFFLGVKNVNEIRHVGGYFNDYEVYVLLLLLFSKNFDIKISRRKTNIFIFILSVSTIIYFSRTNIVQFIVLFIAMKGYFRLTVKSMKVISISIISLILIYGAIYYSNPTRQGKGLETFLYKVKNAPIEAFKMDVNEKDWKDFNDNYRSFENIITVKQVTSTGILATIFGKGLGSTVDVGRVMLTNDGTYIRYVPTLHNSYMTIFLKSGLLGVFLTIVFIYVLYKQKKSQDVVIKNINYLLVGSAIFLILSNWVFMGLYLKLDNKSIFLGFLICYKELFIKEKISTLNA